MKDEVIAVREFFGRAFDSHDVMVWAVAKGWVIPSADRTRIEANKIRQFESMLMRYDFYQPNRKPLLELARRGAERPRLHAPYALGVAELLKILFLCLRLLGQKFLGLCRRALGQFCKVVALFLLYGCNKMGRLFGFVKSSSRPKSSPTPRPVRAVSSVGAGVGAGE